MSTHKLESRSHFMDELSNIDKEIHKCNICGDMIEKFPDSKTVSIGQIMVGEKVVLLGMM